MNKLSLNLMLKSLCTFVFIISGHYLFYTMSYEGVTYVTLFEQYFPKRMFDTYFALNRETILFLLPLVFYGIQINKIREYLLFLGLAILFLLCGNLNQVFILAYGLLALCSDQTGKKNFFYSIMLLAILLVGNKLYDLIDQTYIPLFVMILVSSVKRSSKLFESLLVVMIVSTFRDLNYNPIILNISIVCAYLISYIKHSELKPFQLLIFWSLFNGFPIPLTVMLLCIYICEDYARQFNHSKDILYIQNTLVVFSYVACIYLSNSMGLMFLIPIVLLIAHIGKEYKKEMVYGF